MSETVLYKGKLTTVPNPEGKSLGHLAHQILADKDKYHHFSVALEWLLDNYHEQYVVVEGVLYSVGMTHKGPDEEDILDANLNQDGTISFILKYYNGGCCFSEAIQQATDRMEKPQ